jgi:class I fructose-bisphosphate aldolase
MEGCKRRVRRLFSARSDKTILLPLDHGVTEGLLPGLEDMKTLLQQLDPKLVQGVILHKGLARELGSFVDTRQNLIVHLSAGTRHGLPPYNRSLVCSIQEALRIGADAVSVHINIGNDLEDRMLSDLGMVVDEAHQLGIPVLAAVFARGGQIVNELDPTLVAHCIRLGAELGADIVIVPFSGETDSFARAIAACPVPVLIAGGPRQPGFKNFLQMIKQVMDTGAKGVSIGRNIFQHPEPIKALEMIAEIVHV